MKLDLVRTPRPALQIARGIVIVCSALLFMTALKYLPLAEATALTQIRTRMVADEDSRVTLFVVTPFT